MKTDSDEITLEDLLGPDKPHKSRHKKPGELKATTARAKELFLFGNGDGKPIRDINKLAHLSGASPRTLENWLAVWKRESEEISRGESAGKRGLVANVTGEEIKWHADKVLTLKMECERLQKILPKLPAGSDIHRDTLKLLSATLARWEESSGFAAYADCQASLAKEMAKIAARANARDGNPPIRQAGSFAFDTGPKKIG